MVRENWFSLVFPLSDIHYIILHYYPTAVNTVQITVQMYSDTVQLFVQTCLLDWWAWTRKTVTLSLFPDKFIDYSCSWIINLLLDVLMCSINFLLTEREGRTGEYWPKVVAVRTERSEVRTKTTEGQYSPVRLEQARLVSSLLYGIVFEETLPVISSSLFWIIKLTWQMFIFFTVSHVVSKFF